MNTTTDWPTCRCGCGEPVAPSERDHARDGLVKGGPTKYATGHSPRARAGDPLHRYVEDPNTGCWVWTGDTTMRSGYGRLDVGGRKVPAHRYFYEWHIGAIAPGLVLHHDCRNRLCVNPAHLTPLSPEDHARLHGAERVKRLRCPLVIQWTPELFAAIEREAERAGMTRSGFVRSLVANALRDEAA